MRSRGTAQVVWLLLMFFACAVSYIVFTYMYSEVLSRLITQLDYSPPANFNYLDQLIYGFIWIFLASIIISFIIESYKRSGRGK